MEHIAILCGGNSAERNISLLSAKTVFKYLNRTKYIAVIIDLKDEDFVCSRGIINKKNFTLVSNKKIIKFKKVFVVIHGPPAENGIIQDYFDKLNIKYTCCNSDVSNITFDKFRCNKELVKLGFSCAKSILVNKNFNINYILENISLPIFIKPNRSGSSYGISKVVQKDEISNAIYKASKYDCEIIVEEEVKGSEISCGVYKFKDKIIALPITEIISENIFFDFEAKYEGKSKEITPARINDLLTEKIQNISKSVYSKMNLSGVCRIDFILEKDEVFIIEINTIPGMSKNSIIPQQIAASNINFSDFLDICLTESI